MYRLLVFIVAFTLSILATNFIQTNFSLDRQFAILEEDRRPCYRVVWLERNGQMVGVLELIDCKEMKKK